MRPHDTHSSFYFVVEEPPLDEWPGQVRDDFFGRTFPEQCLPRRDFFDLLPARPLVDCFWLH